MSFNGDLAASLSAAATQPARIGPNAATRLAEALEILEGEVGASAVFEAAGLGHFLDRPPQQMIDERDVIELHRAGLRLYGEVGFAPITLLAGELTGDYLLANRIPLAAQRLLRPLPASLSGQALVRAIGAHAWTFVGSGSFRFQSRQGGLLLIIEDSPLARGRSADAPLCGYFASTFERVFRAIVSPATRVREIRCMATGAPCCEFEVNYRTNDG